MGPFKLDGVGSSFEAAKGEVLSGIEGGYVVFGDTFNFFKTFQLSDEAVGAILADG